MDLDVQVSDAFVMRGCLNVVHADMLLSLLHRSANLDTSNPKSIKALKGQLERDERGRIKDRTDADKARGEMQLRDEVRVSDICLIARNRADVSHCSRYLRDRRFRMIRTMPSFDS